ncbi:glutaredoxin domain-containing protein [Fonticella tunisiensis]|uniref:Glutaredoxin n=1 Tax=Fonticella tunisiensis TaxID=1096341 RepID=A0A4R7KUE7_9CLOT|nr:glutaredoxin domain-containing protein [Fonticella tunisiensis]TDT63703.1 glutaredoxin [Fonticella tunisiensis]
MKYVILTTRGCNRCDLARKLLEENGVEYREVDAITSGGIELVLKYNTNMMPSIIDIENNRVFSISDFKRFLEMQNYRY